MLRSGILLKSIFQCTSIVYGIMGGFDISIEDVPHQVNYGDLCGGVLIHPKWVLTSAHCGKEENFIRVGSKFRLNGSKLKVLSHLVHPNFGQSHKHDYDVQLLRLRRNLRFTRRVKGIGIGDRFGGHILVSGWGYLKEKGEYNDVLQQVVLNLIPKDQCQRVNNAYYNYTLTDRMFCAGGFGKDACQGDSGGGAISSGKLIGISAFGYGCGRNIPGVYINITETTVREWIRGYTGV